MQAERTSVQTNYRADELKKSVNPSACKVFRDERQPEEWPHPNPIKAFEPSSVSLLG